MATKKRKLSDYHFDEHNINKGSEYGSSLLEKSLREVGLGRSVLADKNGVLIAGNQTVQKASELGFEDVIEIETDGKTLVVVRRTDLDINTEMGVKAKILDNTVQKNNYVEDAEVVEAICSTFEIEPADMGLSKLRKLQSEDEVFEEKELKEEIATEHQCPKCGYEF